MTNYFAYTILVIFVLIISGCKTPEELGSSSSKTLLEIQECSRYKYDVKKDNCIFLAAYKNNDIKACDYISSNDNKEFCLGLLGGDITVCESSFELDAFKNLCIALIAALKKDEDICNKITSENKEMEKVIKEGCLAKVFTEKRDSSSCDKLSSIDLSSQCKLLIAVENEDLAFCQTLPDSESFGYSQKETCILLIAENKKDDSLCSQMKTEITKKSCLKSVAVAKKDESICEKISEDDVNSCLKAAAENKKDPLICDEVKISKSGDCYLLVAITKNDVTLCDNTQNKKQCISQLAAYNIDLSLCQNLEDFKDGCIYNIAYVKNDPSLCESIINEKTKEMCLSTVRSIPKIRDLALNFLSQSS